MKRIFSQCSAPPGDGRPGRRACRFIWLVLLLAAKPGCDSSSDSRTATVIVRGSVSGGSPIAGATISFIEAFSVEDSRSLQPLEDAAPGATARVVTDPNGEFAIEVAVGRYFLYVIPPAVDDLHLPGGSLARRSVSLTEQSIAPLDIILSEKPPAGASYVGSSTCLGCHPSHVGATRTLHFVGLRKLTAVGPQLSALQDLGQFPDADQGLACFPDGNVNDNTGSGDGFGFRIATEHGYRILLGLDASGYFQAVESEDGTIVSERLYIAFTYGGEGRFRQLYVTRLDKDGFYTANATLGSYHLLPGQFSETRGDSGRAMEVTVPGWTTYHPERWAAPLTDGSKAGVTPLATESFDNGCAGCHYTGMRLARDSDGLFQAHAVSDPGGALDIDGDGFNEEINIGCERCHGPGSEHASQGRGSIVQPEYLPPGRANLVCGQCHIDGRGNGTVDGEGRGNYPSRNNPENGEIEFVCAGLPPAEFFATSDGTGILPNFGTTGGFFNPVDLREPPGSWRDSAGAFGSGIDHARRNTWHYFDHVRSKHALNPFKMLTCWDCHDVHAVKRLGQTSQESKNNVLCLDCHAGQGDFTAVTDGMIDVIRGGGPVANELKDATHEHVTWKTFDLILVAMNLGPAVYGNPGGNDALGRCTICHMPRTARSGNWIEDDEGFIVRGDISSHAFDNISPDTSEAMTLGGVDPVVNSCVECHRGILRGSWPDYRYKK